MTTRRGKREAVVKVNVSWKVVTVLLSIFVVLVNLSAEIRLN